ncbi:MAG: hypothetical protein M3N95_12140 [Actinomycetota bacterium]|nr:hypothetical protein [Actinomycetota bacterium]
MAGLAALLTSVMFLASCTGTRASNGAPSYGSGAEAPTVAEVTTLLQRHSAAVRNHSVTAFMADIDPSPAADAYRAAQAAEIDSLSHIPLRSWVYSVNSPVTDLSVVKSAAARLGASTTIVHVSIAYAIDAVDQSPVSHDLWWTFVRRNGRVYVASDTDLSGLGGQSWRGPWDFGPVISVRTGASLVLGPPSAALLLTQLSSEVDAAVSRVAAVWGNNWDRVVALVLPSSSAEFVALTGQSDQPGGTGAPIADVAAETVFESPDAATGGGAGARVIINGAALGVLTPLGRRIVLQHEITHVATAASTTVDTPRWLIEGYAEFVGNLGSGQPVRVAAAELAAEVAKGTLPAALPTTTDFASSTRVAAVYEQSWLACRLIAARAGQSGLTRLYRMVGQSNQIGETAVASAIQAVLHESTTAFISQWRTYLTAQLS